MTGAYWYFTCFIQTNPTMLPSFPNVSLLKKSGRTGGRDRERGRNLKFVISLVVLRDSCAVYFYLLLFLLLLSIILKFILYSEAFLYGALSLIWNMMAWLSYFLHLHPRERVSWLISNDRNWSQVWLTNVPTGNSLPFVLCRVVLFTVNLRSSYLRCVYRRESDLLSNYNNAAVVRILEPAAWQLKHA